MANRVPFLVAEMGPNVDPFMLHIYASLAEISSEPVESRRPSSWENGRLNWLNGAATTETDIRWSSLFDTRYQDSKCVARQPSDSSPGPPILRCWNTDSLMMDLRQIDYLSTR
jgi:hypothetical protein